MAPRVQTTSEGCPKGSPPRLAGDLPTLQLTMPFHRQPHQLPRPPINAAFASTSSSASLPNPAANFTPTNIDDEGPSDPYVNRIESTSPLPTIHHPPLLPLRPGIQYIPPYLPSSAIAAISNSPWIHKRVDEMWRTEQPDAPKEDPPPEWYYHHPMVYRWVYGCEPPEGMRFLAIDILTGKVGDGFGVGAGLVVEAGKVREKGEGE